MVTRILVIAGLLGCSSSPARELTPEKRFQLRFTNDTTEPRWDVDAELLAPARFPVSGRPFPDTHLTSAVLNRQGPGTSIEITYVIPGTGPDTYEKHDPALCRTLRPDEVWLPLRYERGQDGSASVLCVPGDLWNPYVHNRRPWWVRKRIPAGEASLECQVHLKHARVTQQLLDDAFAVCASLRVTKVAPAPRRGGSSTIYRGPLEPVTAGGH